MRSIVCYLRTMPANTIARKCARRQMSAMSIGFGISDSHVQISPNDRDGPMSDYQFRSVDTNRGRLSVLTRFRNQLEIKIAESDRLLSSRLVENYFDRPDYQPGSTPFDGQVQARGTGARCWRARIGRGTRKTRCCALRH